MPIAFRPWQPGMLDHLTSVPRCALWASMGSGKTMATVLALDALDLTEPTLPALVLAPLRVASGTWPDELKRWAPGANVTRIAGAQDRADRIKRVSDFNTINYEHLPALVAHWGDRWPYRTIVADESTRLKGFRVTQGGVRAHALAQVAHKRVGRFIQLTGTPSPNGLADLWGQLWFLDGGRRLGLSYSAFIDRWFQKVPGTDGYTQVRPLRHAQAEIQDLIADLCLSVVVESPDPIVSPVYVDLPPVARRHYDEMEKEFFTELAAGHEIEAFNPGSKAQKLMQLANGAVYTNPERTAWATTHDAKLDALESIISEANGMPVLVAYKFRHDLARILRRFRHARQLDANPKTIDAWNRGEIPILVAHPASAGHGLNLQDGGNVLAAFGHDWNLEEWQQIVERIGPLRQMQSGHPRPVYVYPIIARDTLDQVVVDRRESKRSVQDALLAYMGLRV